MALTVDAASANLAKTNYSENSNCNSKKIRYTEDLMWEINKNAIQAVDIGIIKLLTQYQLLSANNGRHNLKTTKTACDEPVASNNKRKKTDPKYILVNWNIEGFSSVMRSAPENDIVRDADLVCLTETLACDDICLQGYYAFSSYAVKPQKGRPIGGITIFAKPHLQPKIIQKEDNYLSIHTSIGQVQCYYFNPSTDLHDILQSLTEHLQGNTDCAIVTGDFNCRTDGDDPRGYDLVETMRLLNFELTTDENTPYTYISHNGKSNIDLTFINTGARKAVIKTYIAKNPIRKHQRVFTALRRKKGTFKSVMISKSIHRTVNINKIINHPDIVTLTGVNVEEINTLTKIILESTDTPRRKVSRKPWFDHQCKQSKSECIKLISALKITAYDSARKNYRRIIKAKKSSYEEARLIQKISEAELHPWRILSKTKTTNNQIRIEDWEEHFSALFNHPRDSLSGMQVTNDERAWYNDPLTKEEIFDCVSKLKSKKAAGLDKITNEQIIIVYPLLDDWWVDVLNKVLDSGEIPTEMRTSKIKTLYKGKGDSADPDAYRGLAMESNHLKLITKLVNNRISLHLEEFLPQEQYGFRKKVGCEDAISQLITAIHINVGGPKKSLYAAFIDFRKAFDVVNRRILCEKLLELGIKGKIFNLIKSLLHRNYIRIDNGEELSETITQTQGVLQGDPLSPTLFLVYVQDLPGAIKTQDVSCLMYADDLVIYSNNLKQLQESLNKLNQWCELNKLDINPMKSNVMKFRKGGRLRNDDEVNIGAHQLKFVNEYEYLGVTLQTTLTLTSHIATKTMKMARVIGTMKWMQKLSLDTAIKVFNIKIWPAVTYGFMTLCKQLTATHLLQLDKIKARFLKKTLALPKNASNTFTFHLANTKTMGEDIIACFKGVSANAQADYRIKIEEKNMEFVTKNFTEGPAFNSDRWKAACQSDRHLVTAFTLHGYHHLVCSNQHFHTPDEEYCKCRLCDQPMHRYHLTSCNKRNNRSLAQFISDLNTI